MEICISEKRHCGPLGPRKYKYFNNKHVQCLPPVKTPGYYFTLNAEKSRLDSVCTNCRCFLLFLEVIFMWKVFPTDTSFGEVSLIKSQSHLRSHIRIDQFSHSWNCSWPLLPWALIQNQQHGHRGLKQLNGVGLQEASESMGGKYQKQQRQLGISGFLSCPDGWLTPLKTPSPWHTAATIYNVKHKQDLGFIYLHKYR